MMHFYSFINFKFYYHNFSLNVDICVVNDKGLNISPCIDVQSLVGGVRIFKRKQNYENFVYNWKNGR